MNSSSTTAGFDRIVWLVIGALALLVAGLVWQNQRTVQSLVSPDDLRKEGQSLVIYSALDENYLEQLYFTTLKIGETGLITQTPRALSRPPGSVWDFSAAPRGQQIIYSALTERSTSDLWLTSPYSSEATLLLACPEAACTGATWSPDARLIAYSRRNTGSGSAMMNPPRLWLLDRQTGETSPVFGDSQMLAFEARWSADGKWLSYLAPDLGGVGVINLADGATQLFETSTGEPGIWHGVRNQLVISIMQEKDQQYLIHLWLIDPVTGERHNLSGTDALVEDNSPAWSPDGEWLAFRRRELTGERASLSKQLWRMGADGSNAEPLTIAPEFEHSQPVWSADGRYLIFHKFPLKGAEIVLSVWVLEVATGQSWEVARPAQRPQWIP